MGGSVGDFVSSVGRQVGDVAKTPVGQMLGGAAIGGMVGGIPGTILGGTLGGKMAGQNNQVQAFNGGSNGVMPAAPTWDNRQNADGTLQSQFQLQKQGPVTMDQRGVDALRSSALSQGPSPWAAMATQKQGLEQMNAMNSARQQAAGAQGQAMNSLMMRGGMSSGARERLAQGGARNQMFGAQQVFNQGMTDRANIGLQDAQMKRQDLNSLINADQTNANFANSNRDYASRTDEFNLRQTMDELNRKRGFDQNRYNQEMALLGANRTADAQLAASREAGKKDGLLGIGILGL